MRVLFALVPYVAALWVYGLAAREVFSSAGGQRPKDADWRLLVPVVIGGGLTPLAVAAKATDGSYMLLLTSPSVLAFAFALVVVRLLRSTTSFLRLYVPVALARTAHPLRGRHVLVGCGVLIVAYGAVLSCCVPADW